MLYRQISKTVVDCTLSATDEEIKQRGVEGDKQGGREIWR